MDYRQIYFFRNSIRTLMEIRGSVAMLRKEKLFLGSLQSQPREVRDSFNALEQAMTQSHELIKKLRNEVGGHLLHQAVVEALDKIAPETESVVQLGNRAKNIHYKFALEVLGAVMLRKVDIAHAREEWQSILHATADLSFSAIRAIDMLFMAYVNVSGLRV
jgi:hypothetical protein